jgi:hypothetical protein
MKHIEAASPIMDSSFRSHFSRPARPPYGQPNLPMAGCSRRRSRDTASTWPGGSLGHRATRHLLLDPAQCTVGMDTNIPEKLPLFCPTRIYQRKIWSSANPRRGHKSRDKNLLAEIGPFWPCQNLPQNLPAKNMTWHGVFSYRSRLHLQMVPARA